MLTTREARPASSGGDVAHRREQPRVQRDAGSEAEQQHARRPRSSRLAALDGGYHVAFVLASLFAVLAATPAGSLLRTRAADEAPAAEPAIAEG